FLHLGRSPDDALARVTSVPARVIGMADRIGTLAVGACGDAVVFDHEEGSFQLVDSRQQVRVGHQRLVPRVVVKDGRVYSGIPSPAGRGNFRECQQYLGASMEQTTLGSEVPTDDVARERTRILAALVGCHAINDFYGVIVAPMLPAIRASFALSYSAVAVVPFLTLATSAMLQPTLGYVADRKAIRRQVMA